MLNRVLKSEYVIPPSPPISEECRDLLKRILVSDPSQRLTVAGIQDHPWFRENLPEVRRCSVHRRTMCMYLAV